MKQFYNSFNTKLAVIITNAVGSMTCAYIFSIIAFSGLHDALLPGGIGFIPWLSGTFLQLVLLSVIMVGQGVQSIRTEKIINDMAAEIKLELALHKEEMIELSRIEKELSPGVLGATTGNYDHDVPDQTRNSETSHQNAQ